MFEQLIADIKSRGIARTNRYEVVISGGGGAIDSTSLNLSCEVATMPGRGYSTAERRMYGPLQKFPYEKLFNEITLTFRCDRNMSERRFFQEWLNLISDENTHEFKYYEDYVGEIVMSQLDGDNSKKYRITISEAYPSTIGDLELSQQSSDEYHRLPVTFVYKEWKEA